MSRSISLKLFVGGVSLFILQFHAFSQEIEPLRFNFKGKLADYGKGSPIAFANIYNINLKTGTISDTLGIFSIPARYNDVLSISCIGYNSKNILVTDTLMRNVFIPYIFLTEKIYELDKVDIRFFGTYQDFKYRILHSKLPESKLNARIKEEFDELPAALQFQPPMPSASPITGLYMLFSKHGKSLRKLEEAKKDENVQSRIAPKFNRETIAKISKLEGRALDDFILFCQPDPKTLMNADEFQIYRIILDYLEKYRQSLITDSIKKQKSK